MKTLIILLFVGLFGSICCTYGQEKDTVFVVKQKTQSTHKPGLMWRFTGLEPRYGKEGEKYDRLIVDLVYNDWVGNRNGTRTAWYSIGYNVNLLFDVPFNRKSTTSLGIGISYSHVNLMHNGMLAINEATGTTTLQTIPDGGEPRNMGKFVANYLEIPVEFRFRSSGYQHFKFHLGFKAGIRLNSFEKWRDGDLKFREYNHPDVARFRFGPTVRIGIRNWSIYGAYFFSDLFTNGQSSKLNPISLGVSISLF